MRRTETLSRSGAIADLLAFARAGDALLLSGLSRLRGGVVFTIRTMQHARMMAVLSEFSDARLAVHGITREEIPEYAARLLGHDTD